MNVTTNLTDNTFEARLSGNLSFSDNGAFRRVLDEMQSSKAGQWVLELSELTSVDSAALGMFIIAQEMAKKAGRALILRRPAGHVKNLIELSKMDKLITVQP